MSWQQTLIKAEKKPKKGLDYNWIKDEYRKWGKQARASGETIGASSGSVYQFLINHGKKNRGVGGSDHSAFPVLQRLGQMMSKDITKEDYQLIMNLIPVLENIEKSDNSNPANIKFTSPLRIKHGRRTGTAVWYGHYRSSYYVKWRRKLQKLELVEFVPQPVASDWFNKNKFLARPPVWQALFADEGNNSTTVIVKKGLLPMLREYKKVVEG